MKIVVGIISIILFVLISFQSCAAGIGNALEGSGEISGSAGFVLAVCMLIGGILALASKNNKGVLITSIVFYCIGGILAIANVGSYADLMIWAVVAFIFAILLIIHCITYKPKKKKSKINKSKISSNKINKTKK